MKVKIEFEVELPDINHSQKELTDYLRYHFRDNGVLNGGNPFEEANRMEPEPIFGTFEWEYESIDENLVTEWD